MSLSPASWNQEHNENNLTWLLGVTSKQTRTHTHTHTLRAKVWAGLVLGWRSPSQTRQLILLADRNNYQRDHSTSLHMLESKQVSIFISIKPRSVFCSDRDKMYKL